MSRDNPHTAITTKSVKGDLIMNEINIHNFQYFLKELQKNLIDLEHLIEQDAVKLHNLAILHNVMEKMCNNWKNQLEHQR